ARIRHAAVSLSKPRALPSSAEAIRRRAPWSPAHQLLIAICLSVSGCAVNSTFETVGSADQKAPSEVAAGPPRLQAGEKIHVTVYGEPSLSGDYQIDPSGFVSLPLAGTVKAEGSTQSGLERALAKKFRGEYLRDPKVTVSVVEFRPFYIM